MGLTSSGVVISRISVRTSVGYICTFKAYDKIEQQ